jgi:diguanylate cyclase (GGDEF)-like protein/PAS domain S-box-containing protein
LVSKSTEGAGLVTASKQRRESVRSATKGVDPELLHILQVAGAHPIVKHFPEGAIAVFDSSLRYLCAGGSGLGSVGLDQASVEGHTIFEVFSPEIVAILEAPYRAVFEGHEAKFDIQVGERTFLHSITPLTDADGAIVAGIGYALDVTADRDAVAALRDSEKSVREERRRLRDAENIGHSGSWEWDIEFGIITWSEGLATLHGLTANEFHESYEKATSFVHPEDLGIVDEALASCRRNVPADFRYRIIRASDGATRWFEARARGVFDDEVLVRLEGVVADITERVEAETEVLETNLLLRAAFLASPDYTLITDIRSGNILFGSRDRDLLGRQNSDAEPLGPEQIEELVHPDDRVLYRAHNAQAAMMRDDKILKHRYRMLHADGSWRWIQREVVPFRRDKAGGVLEVLGVLRDVTDEAVAEEQLFHDALHDELTELPNRALLLDRLKAALSRSAREQRQIAVLFCDLDGFKVVNDTGGHAAGDTLLIEAAERLRHVLRAGDTVARVGGDEFVLVVEPWHRSTPAQKPAEAIDDQIIGVDVAKRIVAAFAPPFSVAGVDYEVTVSVGVAFGDFHDVGSVDSSHASKVIDEADAAMYIAKNEGKNRIHVAERKNADA